MGKGGMAKPSPVSRSLISQKTARQPGGRARSATQHAPLAAAAASTPNLGKYMQRQPTGMVTTLDLGTFTESVKHSWNLSDAEAKTATARKLRGCPGPLPDAAKFGMYQDLGVSDKGLDKTIRRFVSFCAEGAAKTHGPCFRFRIGANMHKLTEHWPACPKKHGTDVLPAPHDQLLQHVADMSNAMLERFGSGSNEPWPLDAHGFPDWDGVTDELRGPPGEGFYPVHPLDVEEASELATLELASKLHTLLEQPESKQGSVGAALRSEDTGKLPVACDF